ncbi:MAG: hypothetical protein WBR18_11880 [Anaerolineales bacterium]
MKVTDTAKDRRISRRRFFGIAFLAWFGVLGFDLMLHGAVLSSFYVQATSFLLPPMESFRRIPIGYASFLIGVLLLGWLISKTNVRGWRQGFGFGGLVGGGIWVSLALGMYSISTAPAPLLLGWVLGQTLEMAYAGSVMAEGFFTDRIRRLTVVVVGLTLLFVVLTIILQSIGLASAVVFD